MLADKHSTILFDDTTFYITIYTTDGCTTDPSQQLITGKLALKNSDDSDIS
jgi:hypothetical protein